MKKPDTVGCDVYLYSLAAYLKDPFSSMLFKVYLMRRGGRRLSWRDVLNGRAYVGDLRTTVEKKGEAIPWRKRVRLSTCKRS